MDKIGRRWKRPRRRHPRRDPRAAAYHVPDAAGMVKLDAMENPYRLPEDVRAQIGELVAQRAPSTAIRIRPRRR